jgi:hypothetical protein
MSNAALDSVLQQAEQAAQNYTPPAVVTSGNQVPAAANQNTGGLPARRSLNDVADSAGLTVDEYLTNKAEGFRIGKEMKGLLEEIIVEIDLSEVSPIFVSRHELNGNTKFVRSYDGVRTSTGSNFEAEVRHYDAQGYKGSGVYESVEIPAELLEDVKDPKSSLVIHEGTTIGITPSMTGAKEFAKFVKAVRKVNPALLDDTVKVKVSHKKRTNSNNNEWGVCVFELIED